MEGQSPEKGLVYEGCVGGVESEGLRSSTPATFGFLKGQVLWQLPLDISADGFALARK